MTETKTSVYDQGHEEDEAPLVEAHPAPVDILSLDATIIDDGDQDASSLPSDPTMHEYDDDIPLFPTEEELRKEETVVGAGVASGVFGLLLGGPLFGLLLGLGAAYACNKPGAAGDTARAVGEIALEARSKARRIDEEHHIVDRSKVVVQETWEKAQQIDQTHGILEKTKQTFVYGWTVTADFVKRHNLVERGVNNVGKAVFWVAEKVASKLEGHPQDQSQEESPSTN